MSSWQRRDKYQQLVRDVVIDPIRATGLTGGPSEMSPSASPWDPSPTKLVHTATRHDPAPLSTGSIVDSSTLSLSSKYLGYRAQPRHFRRPLATHYLGCGLRRPVTWPFSTVSLFLPLYIKHCAKLGRSQSGISTRSQERPADAKLSSDERHFAVRELLGLK